MTLLGYEHELDWFRGEIVKKFEVKFRGRLGLSAYETGSTPSKHFRLSRTTLATREDLAFLTLKAFNEIYIESDSQARRPDSN